MNMRDMKARQQGKAPKIVRKSAGELPPQLDPEEPEPEEGIDAGSLVDQGDGVRVARGRRREPDEGERNHDLPDEPPPGWLGEE